MVKSNNSFDCDLFVIGGGSGGIRSARVAAGLGAKVIIAEQADWGGTCVNLGCIPKKLMNYAAELGMACDYATEYGWQANSYHFSWQQFYHNKNNEIKRLNRIYSDLLIKSDINFLAGHASLVDKHHVTVQGKIYKARYILVASGSTPWLPDISGKEYSISSDDLFHLKELPQHIIIVGGGYIALEFAFFLSSLGVQTELVHRADLPLRGFDEDIRTFFFQRLKYLNVKTHMKTQLQEIKKCNHKLKIILDNNTTINSDCVLFATGRSPLLSGMGLAEQGVIMGPNGIEVDRHYRTNISNIFAIGDVIKGMQLTPIALAEGTKVARYLFADDKSYLDYNFIPTAIFTYPEIATVGFTEAEARANYKEVKIYCSQFTPLKYTMGNCLTQKKYKAMFKMIVDIATDKVVGVHILGPNASEIIQGIAVAMKAGATKKQFDETIGVHPTLAEEIVTLRESE